MYIITDVISTFSYYYDCRVLVIALCIFIHIDRLKER